MHMNTGKRLYIHYGVALCLGLLVAVVLSGSETLPQLGVSFLAVTIPTLYLWLTVNTHWTALLYLALLAMTGVMTPTELWAGSMGHFVVITVLAYMVLNHALKETGVVDWVANWFMTRPWLKGRPYGFLAMFLASELVLGMIMENMSLAVIYVGITAVLCNRLGLKKGDPYYSALFLGVLWVNSVVGIASPISHALPNILIGMATAQGITISYGQWLLVGIPFALIMYGLMMAIMLLWKPNAKCFDKFEVQQVELKPLSPQGKVAGIVFLGVLAWVILPELCQDFAPTLCTYLIDLGVAVPALMGVAVLSIIQVKDKPVLSLPEALGAVPLSAVIFAGVVSLMSVPLAAENVGITSWLGATLSPMLAGVSVLGIVIILVVASLVMTNFLSNAVTMVLFVNVGVALLASRGVSVAMLILLVGFSSSMACLTPSAAVPSPIFFGPGHLKMGDTWKWNILFIVASFVVLMVFVYPFASWAM